ncbi:MAG: hypothetical protein OXH19_07505 [Chloroflexi bacterium]|nr:hypothetical protein [Chloroflexota bacterium]MCY3587612.1 hypothetical protein [Chloroflexota bacterium]MDE2708022.1 hypothetical protein [Chloroflexota bacterium]
MSAEARGGEEGILEEPRHGCRREFEALRHEVGLLRERVEAVERGVLQG